MKLFGTIGLSFLIACGPSANKVKQDPVDILFKDSAGHVITKADILNVTGQVNYEIMDVKTANPSARALHDQARALGRDGEYELAITKLQSAIKIDPTWAYPVYDLAYTYLLKDDYENARKLYKRTDELKPDGFFTTKTALYALNGEQTGRFPKGLYKTYLQIEWTADANEKMAIAKGITEKVPDYAPAWKELAVLLNDKQERLTAIEKGLSKEPDADTKGILLINKAIILNEDGNKEAAKQLLANLIFSDDATTGSIELARFTLRSMIEM